MRKGGSIVVEASAWRTIEEVSNAALPTEAGGILLGYRDGRDVVVSQAIEVRDTSASASAYLRKQEPAERLLRKVLRKEPSSSVLGWVGDFHSHPHDVDASSTDLATLRHNARSDGGLLAMIVAVRVDGGWEMRGYLSERKKPIRADVKMIGGD